MPTVPTNSAVSILLAAFVSLIANGLLGEEVRTHTLKSAFQATPTLVRVLPPPQQRTGQRYPVVYLLPVEAGSTKRWGDPLAEVQRLGLISKYQAYFVTPTFSHLPWYADHPTDDRLRQEEYLLKDVLPLIERTYPVQRQASGRLLLGFSKSGWGAYSLLLRHPKTFARAAAWDAPMMMDAPGKYGSGPIFGSASNFAKYQVSTLVVANAEKLGPQPRLGLFGYDNFRDETQRLHKLMKQHNIPHQYQDGPRRKHHWNSGWMADCAAFLLGTAD